MSDIKISIVIPVYNMAEYLDETIGTWTAQKMPELEIIYINDASTDTTLKILERWRRKDSRIKIINLPENSGPWTARIEGVNCATGEYIMFADADDTITVGACEELYKLIKKNKVDILHFRMNIINVNKKDPRIINSLKTFVKPYKKRLRGYEVLTSCFLEGKYQFSLPNKIFSAKTCKRAFSYMKKESLYMAEDKLAYFLIAFFANSYIGVKTRCCYNYYYGRGGYGRKVLSVEKFERYCSSVIIADRVEEFLTSQGKKERFGNIDYLFRKDLVANCFWKYIGEIPEEKKYICFRIMESYFDQRKKSMSNCKDNLHKIPITLENEEDRCIDNRDLRDALEKWGYKDVADDYWTWYCWTYLLRIGTKGQYAGEFIAYITNSYNKSAFFDSSRKSMYWLLKFNPRLFDMMCVLLGRRKNQEL